MVVNLSHLDGVRICSGVFGGVVIGIMMYTLFHYVRIIKAGHRAILVGHVFTVGASYLGLVLYVSIDAINRIGSLVTWRLPLGLLSLLVGLVGLRSILRYVYIRDLELHRS